MPTYTKGQYRSENNSYIRINTDDATYSLVGSTQEQYQSNGGSVIFTENLKKLDRNEYSEALSNLTTSQRNTYLSGDDPLGKLEQTRTEAQRLYWETLNDGLRQQFLDGEFGTDWKGKFNTETAADLLNNKNFGALDEFGVRPLTADLNFSGAFDRGVGRAVGGTSAESVLKYPIDMDLNIQDHMVITAATRVQARLPKIDKTTDTGQFVRTRNDQLHETIIIPMPNAISSTEAVNYGKGEMGSFAGEVAGPLANQILNAPVAGQGNIGSILDNLGKATAQAGAEMLKGLGDTAASGYLKRKLILQASAGVANLIGVNVDVGQVVNRLTGSVENPNLELLFNGPGLRDFGFNIRFTPRSRREAARVRQIIRTLKRRMAVKRNSNAFAGQGGQNLLLGTPDVFRLEYRRGSTNQEEIKGLNKFKTCVLESLNVDYSAGSGRWSAYGSDSQPVSTIITMNFREIVPIYEDDYTNSGFDYDDVGF